ARSRSSARARTSTGVLCTFATSLASSGSQSFRIWTRPLSALSRSPRVRSTLPDETNNAGVVSAITRTVAVTTKNRPRMIQRRRKKTAKNSRSVAWRAGAPGLGGKPVGVVAMDAISLGSGAGDEDAVEVEQLPALERHLRGGADAAEELGHED